MGLYQEGFALIQGDKKKVERRLNDEKRQKIRVGHTITFYLLPEQKETIVVSVIAIKAFASFEELYRSTDFSLLGREDKSMEWMIAASYDYYKPEDEQKYGVLAIEFVRE